MPAAKTDRERALEYCVRLKNPEFVALTFDDLFGHAPFKPDWAYIESEEKDLTQETKGVTVSNSSLLNT